MPAFRPRDNAGTALPMPWTDRLSLLSAMSFRPFAGLPEFLFDALWSAYWAAYRPGCRGRQRRNAAGPPNLFDRGKQVGGRRVSEEPRWGNAGGRWCECGL